MKFIASCSFGKDSLAMVLKLLELQYPLDEVVFFDSGVEFSCIYKNAEKLKKVLDERGIPLTILKPKESFFWNMLEREVHKKNGTIQYGRMWCGGTCRWGTSLKTDTIKEHNKKYGDELIVEYIGIAVDEPDRLAKVSNNKTNCKQKSLPLVAWEMTEKDCLEYCYSKGYNWEEDGIELYSILDRVSCWCCSNQNLKGLKNMYKYLPKYWEQLKYLQSRIDMPFREDKTIFDLEERFKKELGDS